MGESEFLELRYENDKSGKSAQPKLVVNIYSARLSNLNVEHQCDILKYLLEAFSNRITAFESIENKR
jgi:hypothetical protein